MRPFVLRPRALPSSAFLTLRRELLGSPWVSRSPLVGSFRDSRGFAVIFTHEGRPTLEERFPCLAPYLEALLAPARAKDLQSWTERLTGQSPPPPPNAFYLNLLLLNAGQGVGRHVDATLREASGVSDAVPQKVSVLYLDCPQGAWGGELWLSRENKPCARIEPHPGLWLHFDGALQHEVKAFEGGDPGALRVSLVCEQYVFSKEALARLPSFRLQSKAGFATYLKEASQRRSAL